VKRKKKTKSIYFVQPNMREHDRIKRQYRVKESICKVKILDKEEEFFYVEVLQHIIMLLQNMLTIQHPLTIINYQNQKISFENHSNLLL